MHQKQLQKKVNIEDLLIMSYRNVLSGVFDKTPYNVSPPDSLAPERWEELGCY